MTGLDNTKTNINSDKAYYEITEPKTGDHFLFMALEGGFFTDANNEFSDAQLNWLDSRLNAYKNDGKNTFILEHANFDQWGAGDQLDKPIYDLPLKFGNTSTARLKNILCNHPEAVIITGHTHFKYSLQLNYSNNDKTSATMLHVSSVGGVRDIKNRTTRINDTSLDQTEGYIVEVYDNATIFYGTNVYYNKTNPSATYIVPQTTSAIDPPATQPSTTATQPSSSATENVPTEFDTKPSETIIWGDVDGDNDVSIVDATSIQRHLAGLQKLDDAAIKRGMVGGYDELSILDATSIQRKLAGIIKQFPVETGAQETLAETGANLNTLRSQAKAALDKYWALASYDQYMALKKAYKENADYNTLNAAYTAFSTAVSNFYPGDTITVRFKAPAGWNNVYAYVYNDDNDKLAAWPGKACTKQGSYWTVTVPTGMYNYIIFSSGSNQTYDLALGITKNQGYTVTGSGTGKVIAYPYQY